jgi:uncharacterized membrane protein
MSPVVQEWLNLVVRWAHVIAAIMWIGDSFLFMWMDASLSRPAPGRARTVTGELWMTHSGGFYEVLKHKSLAALPDRLFWFKWQSYATWISGVLLLIVVFGLGSQAQLQDAGAPLPHAAAFAISLALLPVAVAAYELLMRTPVARSAIALGAVTILAVAALAWGVSQLYTARAAFLMVGAMLGTIMTANVFLVIVPGQARMLAATRAGTEVDTTHGVRAKQRSIHNHYLTFPVLFTMLAGHFPSFFGHPQAWAVLTLLFIAGAGLKAMMNFRTRTSRWVVAGTLASLAIAAVMTAPPGESASVRALAAHAPVAVEEARTIVQMRCVVCHAARPAIEAFPAAPNGVLLETPEQMTAWSERIIARVVDTQTMPLGNLTGMTDDERTRLGAWAYQQRKR